MKKSFILALDEGTTSTRAILFDALGRTVGGVHHAIPQRYPQPGWVEQDPEDLWLCTVRCAREVLAAAGIDAREVAAIGVTNQRETVVVWDRVTHQTLAPAIVWQCNRTSDQCEVLRSEGWSEHVRERTGLLIDPYFSATKWVWYLDHVEGLRDRAECGEIAFGTVDTFLLWRLSGGRLHLTDASNAARTMLFDIHRQTWDEGLLKRLGIPMIALPEVHDSSERYGETAPDVFGCAIPLTAAVGDQQAATFGQACLVPGMTKNTYGTGSFLMMNTGATAQKSDHNLLTTVAWRLESKVTYALEGSIFMAGAAIDWIRAVLALAGGWVEAEELAASVPDSGGVYVVPSFAGLGAPYWDPEARGLFCGLTRSTSAAHLLRATMEGVCYQTRDVLVCLAADSGQSITSLRVDGGAAASDLLMQLQADILGIPVERSAQTESTALGAASLAGMAVDLWPDLDDLTNQWQAERVFEPEVQESVRDSRYADWRTAVARARSPGSLRPTS